MAKRRRKVGGRYTEPDLPDRVVVRHGLVTIEHFYRSGDHGPPHLHVSGGGTASRSEVTRRLLCRSKMRLTPTDERFARR
jgi:hypothetical protein